MKSLKAISNYKALVLTIGMMVAIAVIGQPIVKEYIDCPTTCEINDDYEDDSSQDSKEPVTEQISAFDAVAPTAQIQVANTGFFIIELLVHGNAESKMESAPFVEKISQKLLTRPTHPDSTHNHIKALLET